MPLSRKAKFYKDLLEMLLKSKTIPKYEPGEKYFKEKIKPTFKQVKENLRDFTKEDLRHIKEEAFKQIKSVKEIPWVSETGAQGSRGFRGTYSPGEVAISPSEFINLARTKTGKPYRPAPTVPHEIGHHIREITGESPRKPSAELSQAERKVEEEWARGFAKAVRDRGKGVPLSKIPEKYRKWVLSLAGATTLGLAGKELLEPEEVEASGKVKVLGAEVRKKILEKVFKVGVESVPKEELEALFKSSKGKLYRGEYFPGEMMGLKWDPKHASTGWEEFGKVPALEFLPKKGAEQYGKVVEAIPRPGAKVLKAPYISEKIAKEAVEGGYDLVRFKGGAVSQVKPGNVLLKAGNKYRILGLAGAGLVGAGLASKARAEPLQNIDDFVPGVRTLSVLPKRKDTLENIDTLKGTDILPSRPVRPLTTRPTVSKGGL